MKFTSLTFWTTRLIYLVQLRYAVSFGDSVGDRLCGCTINNYEGKKIIKWLSYLSPEIFLWGGPIVAFSAPFFDSSWLELKLLLGFFSNLTLRISFCIFLEGLKEYSSSVLTADSISKLSFLKLDSENLLLRLCKHIHVIKAFPFISILNQDNYIAQTYKLLQKMSSL